MNCNFNRLNGLQCRKNTEIDDDIHYNKTLNVYLCDYHEKIIIQDHLQNYIINRLEKNDLYYKTFSNNILYRFNPINNILHIPNQLPLEHCLYKFTIDKILYINKIYNLSYIEDYLKVSITLKIVDKYEKIYTIDIINPSQEINEVYIINILNDTHTRIYNKKPNIEIMTDTQNNIQNNTQSNNIINRYYNINFDYSYMYNTFIQIIKCIINIDEENTIDNEIELINIDNCNICYNDNCQKGFKMTCCNTNIEICVSCIIDDFITNELKYKSLCNIKNMDLFLISKPCFYCRKSNIYKQLIYDSECKSIFLIKIGEKFKIQTNIEIDYFMNELAININ